MANLKAIIRLRKHGLDERRRALAQLYREQEIIEKQKKIIEDQMAREIELGAQMATPETDASLGKYLEGARKKVQALEKSIRAMDQRIAAAQEDIRSAFTEMKKVEVTQTARDKREVEKQRKKEDKEMDDIAVERFARKDETGK